MILPKSHEDHIAVKEFNLMNHYHLVQKFMIFPQTMKIPDAKAAMDKEWVKFEKLLAWQVIREMRGYCGSTEKEKQTILPR